jgi:hypothetical protein
MKVATSSLRLRLPRLTVAERPGSTGGSGAQKRVIPTPLSRLTAENIPERARELGIS